MKNIFLTIICFFSVYINAQVIISTDSTYTTTSPKVALDINGNGGVLMPRVELNTLFPQTNIPKEGTVVYNTLENATNSEDRVVVGYYIFTDKKWRLLLNEKSAKEFFPKRITYIKSTFNKTGGESGSLILNPETYNNVNPETRFSEDKTFDVGVHENPYEKWKNIENFHSKINISEKFHQNNKLILAIDGPISFTNYGNAIATFSVGVFLHKLEEDQIVESKFIGARIFDVNLSGICTSSKRTPSFLMEDIDMGDYIVEPVYRLIYSYDYNGGYNESSSGDKWDYYYAGNRDGEYRRTRMFIGVPEETQYYYTMNYGGIILNFDGSVRSRPPGECSTQNAFSLQSTIELIIYEKD